MKIKHHKYGWLDVVEIRLVNGNEIVVKASYPDGCVGKCWYVDGYPFEYGYCDVESSEQGATEIDDELKNEMFIRRMK